MLATSEEVGSPSGRVRKVPLLPFAAIESIAGVSTASRGVLPLSCFNGTSAIPSAKNINAFAIYNLYLKFYLFISY
jgi:hypothetical protein